MAMFLISCGKLIYLKREIYLNEPLSFFDEGFIRRLLKILFSRGQLNKQAIALIEALREIVYFCVAKEIFQRNNGKDFFNGEMNNLCNLFKILR